MNPQSYGITAICLGVLGLLTGIFKRRINKAVAAAFDRNNSKRIEVP